MSPKTTRTRRDVPEWAVVLRTRRAALGKSQEAVALDSGILNQTTVSELEGGRYELANLTAARLAGLARGLNWTLAELERAVQLDFGLGGYEQPPAQKSRPLPDSLQEAIDLYGKRYADLLEPAWQQYLAGFRWRQGMPTEPEAWLDLYRDLTRAGVIPGEVN